MTEKNQSGIYRPGLEVVPGYTLVRPLGSGMAGDVWVARAAGGTLVAVKIVRSLSKLGGRKEFLALKTLRNIRHPNLCPVHGFWTKDADGVLLEDGETQSNLPSSGVATFNRDGTAVKPSKSSMQETMAVGAASESNDDPKQPEGNFPKAEQLIVVIGLGDSTLNDRLMDVRAEAGIAEKSTEEVYGLDAAEVIDYLRAASKAIDELNLKHNIYHCDIKPQNILKVGGGIQVCDFGLANRFQGDLRKTQQAFASPAYAAPEVLLGSTYSRTVDQYSLAITYYELRTGVLPFDTTTQASVIIAKQDEKLDFRHSTPAERKVLRKATKAEPLERYETCAEFVSALAIASGVEKRSGITPKRAGIGAAVLLALIGVVAYFGFQTDAATSISSAKMIVESIDNKPTSVQLDAIAQSLKQIELANDSSPTADQKLEMTEFASHWADKLVAGVFAESKHCVSSQWVDGKHPDEQSDSGDAQQSQTPASQAKMFRNYLATVENLYGDDPVLNRQTFAELPIAVALAHTQLDLITDVESTDRAYQERIATLRSQIDNQLERNPDALLWSVAVAISHYEVEPAAEQYLDQPALADIASAQGRIDQTGIDSLPIWFQQQWKLMKLQFLDQFKTACESPDQNPSTVAAIRETWPFIASDALLGRMIEMSASGNWQEFKQAATGLPESLDDPDRDRTIQLIREMLVAIESPESSATHIDHAYRLLLPDAENEEFLIDDFLSSLSQWLAEISRRAMDQRLAYSKVNSICRSADALLDGVSTQVRRPVELDVLLMAAAIREGPATAGDTPYNDSETIEQIAIGHADKDELAGSVAKAIQIERDPIHLGRRVRSWIQQNQDHPELARLTSKEYVEYLKLISHGGSGTATSESWQRWQVTGNRAKGMREVLHPERRRRIADAYLRVATVQSGVSDRTVTRLRYADSDNGKQAVANADWWLEDQTDDASATNRRLATEKLLLRIAEAKRNQQSLHELIEFGQLGDMLADDAVNPRHGQLYRAAFEVLRSKANAPNQQLSSEEANSWIEAAVAMCDLVNANNVDRDSWQADVLDPVMALIQQRPPESLPADAKFRFFDHYLMANEKTSGIANDDASLWSNLEFASSGLAQNDQLAEQRRLQLWLQASDALQQQMQTDSKWWSDADLDVLRRYLGAAVKIDPENPVLKVHIAFGKYYKARGDNDRAKLMLAEQSLDEAIARLKDSVGRDQRALVQLYEALWTHANLLVILAFEERGDDKEPLLIKAHDSATSAIELLRDEYVSSHVFRNGALMALGNSCEDLAHYCSKDSITDQRSYFQEAIGAFEKAVKATKFDAFGSSMKPRYSMARCRFRFALAEEDHGEPGRARELREQAKRDLGEFNDRALPSTQMKWLAWSANIASDLGDRESAIADMERSYQIAIDQTKKVSARDRSEVVLRYARMLAEGTDTEKRKAVELIGQIELPLWPAIEEKCRWLADLDRSDDVLRFVRSITSERLEQFADDPESIAVHLVMIADAVRLACEDPSEDDQANALESLRTIEQATFTKYSDRSASPTARAYRSIYLAHMKSLDQKIKASERIEGFIAALRATNRVDMEPAIIESLELALLVQFWRDGESLGEIVAELSERDRDESKLQLKRIGTAGKSPLQPAQVRFRQGLLRML